MCSPLSENGTVPIYFLSKRFQPYSCLVSWDRMWLPECRHNRGTTHALCSLMKLTGDGKDRKLVLHLQVEGVKNAAFELHLLVSPWCKTLTQLHTCIPRRTFAVWSSVFCRMGLIFLAVQEEELMWESQPGDTTTSTNCVWSDTPACCHQTPLPAVLHNITYAPKYFAASWASSLDSMHSLFLHYLISFYSLHEPLLLPFIWFCLFIM